MIRPQATPDMDTRDCEAHNAAVAGLFHALECARDTLEGIHDDRHSTLSHRIAAVATLRIVNEALAVRP